ncbi:uncharacterized protein LOC119066111 [Bradysia coprophila]|uniref:uncharacterized protein LOC119066111 n=1 Tax=Bradysia coprophila TaxID=38358 RepID=UPI00187DB6B6|nr:uncharacterized protein LOC119066111 [Bradysia coprophila]
MLSANIPAPALLCLFTFLKTTTPTVYLRNPNERGPTAVNAGTKCICAMSVYYFNDPLITRTTNLEYFHSSNLSAPSADIGSNFLVNIHAMITDQSVEGLQIRVTSDATGIYSLVNVDPRSILSVDYYVFVVDDIRKFKEDLQNVVVKSPSWNPGARFLVLFNNPDVRIDANGYSGVDIASKFFDLLYNRFNVARAVILYASGIKTYNIYVTNPYKNEGDCRSLKPILIDVCDNGILKHTELTKISIRAARVPEKVPACTFTFCTRESEPYIEENCTSGLEIDIVRTIQDIMKFQTNIICSSLPRGDMHNGSWTGLLRLVREDKCDFVFGGFFPDNDVHEDFGHTSSYFEDTYTWYIYFAPLRPRWKGLIEIFQSETWLLLIGTLFIAGLSWFVFGKAMAETNSNKKLVLCVMNSLAVILGISSNNRPDYTPLRIFFVLLALYGLNVTTIYTSKLITVFTEPAHEQQITTIQEILKERIPIGGQEEYEDWFMNENPLDQIISEKYNNSDHFLATLENMALVREGYISILTNRMFVLSHDLQEDIFGIPGNVFTSPLEMIAERGFPLIKKFSSLIHRMKDAGLTSKIYKDFLHNKTILDFIRHRDRIHEVGQITLTLDHLQGAFAVLIIGLIISLVVFLIEILLNSKWFIMNYGKLTRSLGRRFHRLKIKPKKKLLKPRRLKNKPKKKTVKLRKKFK